MLNYVFVFHNCSGVYDLSRCHFSEAPETQPSPVIAPAPQTLMLTAEEFARLTARGVLTIKTSAAAATPVVPKVVPAQPLPVLKAPLKMATAPVGALIPATANVTTATVPVVKAERFGVPKPSIFYHSAVAPLLQTSTDVSELFCWCPLLINYTVQF